MIRGANYIQGATWPTWGRPTWGHPSKTRKSAKAVAGSSKIASRTIDRVQSTTKRASNFVSNSWTEPLIFAEESNVNGLEVVALSKAPKC